MKIAASRHREAIAVSVHPKKGLVFFWTKSSIGSELAGAKIIDLPFPLKGDAIGNYAWEWLTSAAEYGPEPDHDGSNGRGWRVYNEDWGHVAGRWDAFFAVQPVWAMYGK